RASPGTGAGARPSLSHFAPPTFLRTPWTLGAERINYLPPPSKRCLKFMAPAVKKIEFLLIGHLFPVCMVFPVLSTSSPPLSHGEISRVCEIPAEILTFPALVENAPQSARSLEQSDVGPVC